MDGWDEGGEGTAGNKRVWWGLFGCDCEDAIKLFEIHHPSQVRSEQTPATPRIPNASPVPCSGSAGGSGWVEGRRVCWVNERRTEKKISLSSKYEIKKNSLREEKKVGRRLDGWRNRPGQTRAGSGE